MPKTKFIAFALNLFWKAYKKSKFESATMLPVIAMQLRKFGVQIKKPQKKIPPLPPARGGPSVRMTFLSVIPSEL